MKLADWGESVCVAASEMVTEAVGQPTFVAAAVKAIISVAAAVVQITPTHLASPTA